MKMIEFKPKKGFNRSWPGHCFQEDPECDMDCLQATRKCEM